MLNLFSLHGRYFQDNENRLTANVLFLLSECRAAFLPAFLARIGIAPANLDLSKVDIRFQDYMTTEGRIDVPDATLRLPDECCVILEAKIGNGQLSAEQLQAYAKRLAAMGTLQKRLVCVTQIDDQENFEAIRATIEPRFLPLGACKYLRWCTVLDVLRESTGLSDEKITEQDRRLAQGKDVSYTERIATLFMREVEQDMYDRKTVDDLPASIDDVVVTTQDAWFMDIAKRHHVWFPSGATEHGLQPAKYVAFYETRGGGNENPKQISYLARNKIFWNRITLNDARQIAELKPLFEDKQAMKTINTWKQKSTFHFALIDEPVKLARPIPIGRKNYARVLSKRRYSLIDILNATTIDSLFSA